MRCALALTLCLPALVGCGMDGPAAGPSPPDGSLLWQYSTGNPGELAIVSPTVADGVVYAGSYENTVYALDAQTGDLRWSVETQGDMDVPPVVDGAVVFVGDLANDYALDASTGELLWREESSPGSANDLQVSDGAVYIATSPRTDDFSVRALDAASGEPMWATRMPRSGLPLFFPLTRAGKHLYVSDDDDVHALDAATGELAWSFRPEAWNLPTESVVQAPPTAAGGRVFMMSGYTALALDEATGEPLWSYEPVVTGVRAYLRAPVVVEGIWYLAADELHALDAATGQQLWSFDANRAADSPVIAAGRVFVHDLFGSTHALDAANGAPVWSLSRDWQLTSVLVAGGVLYAHSPTGHIHTFDARIGEPIWSVDIGYHWFRRPFAVSGGVVYMGYRGADDSGVYAFATPGNR